MSSLNALQRRELAESLRATSYVGQHNGIVASTVTNTQYLQQLYIGYSMNEVKQLWREYLAEQIAEEN